MTLWNFVKSLARQEAEGRAARQPAPYDNGLDEALALAKAGEFPMAFAVYKRAADAGSVAAMVAIGLLYQNGCLDVEGCTGDAHFERAAFWFGKAIDTGQNAKATDYMLSLGHDYDHGNGVAKSEAKAQRCYMWAAKAGNLTAAFYAACNAMHGRGTPKNREGARALLQAVLEQTQDVALARQARHRLAQLEQWEHEEGQRGGSNGSGAMSRAQALEILDLGSDATRAEMKAAWMRLMWQTHPDKGGSTYFAKQLNQVREVLEF